MNCLLNMIDFTCAVSQVVGGKATLKESGKIKEKLFYIFREKFSFWQEHIFYIISSRYEKEEGFFFAS